MGLRIKTEIISPPERANMFYWATQNVSLGQNAASGSHRDIKTLDLADVTHGGALQHHGFNVILNLCLFLGILFFLLLSPFVSFIL